MDAVNQVYSNRLASVPRPAGSGTPRRQVTEIYEASRAGVLRSLLSSGLDAGRAEEVMQEAFLRLYSALQSGEELTNPKGWLFRVAHNLAMDSIKHRRPMRSGPTPWLATLVESGAGAEKELLEKPLDIKSSTVAELLRRGFERLRKWNQGRPWNIPIHVPPSHILMTNC